MGKIDIDFESANRIITGILSCQETAQSIANKTSSIDASIFNSYSPQTVANNDALIQSAGKVSDSVASLGSSFASSVEEYRDALERIKNEVDTNIKDTENNTDKDKTIKVTADDILEEVKASVGFYFNYPPGPHKIQRISKDTLKDILVRRGAKEISKGLFEMKIDGVLYQYNIDKEYFSIPSVKEGQIRCAFYGTNNLDFDNITTTITFINGYAENQPEHCGKISPTITGNMKINDNCLVILPYMNAPLNFPNTLGGTAKVADFMGGGSPKTIVNSITGHSLGGMASYKTISYNPGVYKRLVTVNSGGYGSKTGNDNYMDYNYDAFKDVQIIMIEGENDPFVNRYTHKDTANWIKKMNADNTIPGGANADILTIDTLKKNGIPMSNISILTNDSNFITQAQSYLPSSNIHKVDQTFASTHRGWEGHTGGVCMIVDSNVFNFLSMP